MQSLASRTAPHRTGTGTAHQNRDPPTTLLPWVLLVYSVPLRAYLPLLISSAPMHSGVHYCVVYTLRRNLKGFRAIFFFEDREGTKLSINCLFQSVNYMTPPH